MRSLAFRCSIVVVIATKVAHIACTLVLFSVLAARPASAVDAADRHSGAVIRHHQRGAGRANRTASTPGFYYIEPTKAGSTDTAQHVRHARQASEKPFRGRCRRAPSELHGIRRRRTQPRTIVSSGTASAPVHPRCEHHEPAARAPLLEIQGAT
jgi:hypothetical protein